MDHVKLSFLVGTAAHISSVLLNKNTKSIYLFFLEYVCVFCVSIIWNSIWLLLLQHIECILTY